jgi:hypothetical protein
VLAGRDRLKIQRCPDGFMSLALSVLCGVSFHNHIGSGSE